MADGDLWRCPPSQILTYLIPVPRTPRSNQDFEALTLHITPDSGRRVEETRTSHGGAMVKRGLQQERPLSNAIVDTVEDLVTANPNSWL